MEEELILATVREQLQEDLRCYLDGFVGTQLNIDAESAREMLADGVCQIVVDNFKKLDEL